MSECAHPETQIDHSVADGVAEEVCIECGSVVSEHATDDASPQCGYFEEEMDHPCQRTVRDSDSRCWQHD